MLSMEVAMVEAAQRLYTYEEYLEIEQSTGLKHEYFQGHVLAMAGSTPEHNELGINLIFQLKLRLGSGPCKVYASDLKVSASEDGLYTYPDLAVVCGPLQRSGKDPNAVQNPVVLVEVLSDSTIHYDRVEKFEHYQKIATLRDYVLVDQHRPSVDHLRRNPDQSWTLRTLHLADTLHLESLGVSIPIADIYAGVALQPGTRRLG